MKECKKRIRERDFNVNLQKSIIISHIWTQLKLNLQLNRMLLKSCFSKWWVVMKCLKINVRTSQYYHFCVLNDACLHAEKKEILLFIFFSSLASNFCCWITIFMYTIAQLPRACYTLFNTEWINGFWINPQP